MRTIVLANNKGGVGKTTTSLSLAAGLNAKKKKVLLIDLDAQENLAFTCGVNDEDLKGLSLWDALHGKVDINNCIFQIYDDIKDFDILVGGIGLTKADTDKKIDEHSLKKLLEQLNDNYDYIVIDTPPNLNKLTKSAIIAADDLIIPLQPSPYSWQGLATLYGFVEKENPYIRIDGLLLTGVNERANISKDFIEMYKAKAKEYDTKLYKAMIHNSVAIPDSQAHYKTIYKWSPKSTVAKDYMDFVNEYLKGVKKNG